MNDTVIDPEESAAAADITKMDAMELLALYKKTGDEQLKWEIVLRYEDIVKYVAMQVRGIYSGFAQVEDIINEGLITLLKAIDKFDLSQGVKFETYVSKRIRGMIIDLARKQDWVPRTVRKRAKEIDEATADLANQLGRYPTSSEMAAYLNISEERYQKDLSCIAMNNLISLESLLDMGETESPHFEVASKDSSKVPILRLPQKTAAVCRMPFWRSRSIQKFWRRQSAICRKMNKSYSRFIMLKICS